MTEEKTVSAEPADEQNPAPKRRVRRTAKKQAELTEGAPEGSGAAARADSGEGKLSGEAAGKPSDDPASASAAKIAPKARRSTKRSSKVAAAEAPVADGAAASDGVDASLEGSQKPRRRVARARKPKADPAEAQAVSAQTAVPSGDAAPAEAIASSDSAPREIPAAAGDVPVAEKPKRRVGRPRKQKPADAAEGEGSEPASVSAAPEPSAKKDIKELNRIAQDATHASSEPGDVPGAKALDSVAPEASGAQQAGEARPADSDQPRRGRRNRRHSERDFESDERRDQSQAEKQPDGSLQNQRKKDRYADRGSDGQGGGRNNTRRNNRKNRNRDFNAEPSLSLEDVAAMKVADLRSKAAELEIEYVGLRKPELVEAVYAAAARAEGFRPVDGVLEIGNEGFGWLRTGNYMKGDDDCFVHQQMIRNLGLRPGDRVVGTVGPGRGNAKYPPLIKVTSVNGVAPESVKSRPRFRDLTPVFPNERLVMEHGKDSITGRAIDLVSPIGKGQRGLIVSPPKAGKTTVLKKICQSIAANNPEVHLFCLLVDERPEEVTDMERSIKGEVVASTFDMPADNHTRVSERVIEHAKRLVEMGEDVVVVLDSITRLARAYNLATPASGRILSGGVDSAALYPPKKFLGAARNIENGGSLTIIASALVDTGSKMDEVIFEEFKGTGNMELKLDRDLADRRIFPAIDPVSSGTRNEDLLIPEEYRPFVWGIRRILANMNNTERAANALVKGLKGTNDNREFLIKSAKKAQQTDYIA